MKEIYDFETMYDEYINIKRSLEQYRIWTEDFEDVDTHEIVQVEHKECIGMREPNVEVQVRLNEIESCISNHVHELTDEQLRYIYDQSAILVFLKEAMSRGLDWALNDDKEDINNVTYTIKAHDAETLDDIENFINNLCNEFGTPENVADNLPMQIPYSYAMKQMVDDDRFTGFIDYMRRTSDALILKCACTSRCTDAFATALHDNYGVSVNIL